MLMEDLGILTEKGLQDCLERRLVQIEQSLEVVLIDLSFQKRMIRWLNGKHERL
jgi:hypothetical protein